MLLTSYHFSIQLSDIGIFTMGPNLLFKIVM